MVSEITRKLFKLPLNCFEGGHFFGDYFGDRPSVEGFWIDESNTSSNSSSYFACVLASIKNLLSESVGNAPPDFIHFLAGLLYPDPHHRLTALQAAEHPFWRGCLCLSFRFHASRASRRAPCTSRCRPCPPPAAEAAVKEEEEEEDLAAIPPPIQAQPTPAPLTGRGGARRTNRRQLFFDVSTRRLGACCLIGPQAARYGGGGAGAGAGAEEREGGDHEAGRWEYR